MPRKKNTRSANGTGNIRQRKDGSWEYRYTAGTDPGTGKQIRKSLYGATQKQVLDKYDQLKADKKTGFYVEPSKLTVGAWVDIWATEYLGGVKESTIASYKGHIKNHIKPAIGAVKLQQLTPDAVQKFYNSLTNKKGLSAKTVKNVHGVLYGAMEQAVNDDKISKNPCNNRILPRIIKKEMQVMDGDTVTAFLTAIEGHRFEAIYFIDLFTGLRQSEILGLTWNAINFRTGTITIDRQLVKSKLDGRYYLDTTKHDRVRKIAPAAVVMDRLKHRKAQQAADQLRAGSAWLNEWGLVFTDELGNHLVHHTVRKNYKRIVATLGQPDLTFHALRHSFAVLSLVNGDDPKTVQTNLGHHTAAFTLDVYAHTTEQMQRDSAKRMEEYIKSIQNSKKA